MTHDVQPLSRSQRVARVEPASVATRCAGSIARQPLRWQIGSRALTASLHWHGQTQRPDFCFSLGDGSVTAWLTVDRLDPWIEQASELLAEADPRARALVAQQLAEMTASALGAAQLRAQSVDATELPRDCVSVGVVVAAADHGGSACATLQCDRATAARVTQWWLLRAGVPMLRADLPIDVRVHVASATLTLDDLRALSENDLLLPDRLPLEAGRWQVSLLAGADRRPWARGYIEGDLVVITSTEDTGAAVQADGMLQQITVEIDFEIGTRRLSLGELAQIGPGYVFDLGTRADGDIVDLVANGRRIGRGHLVLLGDALGVRVAQVSLHAPAPAPASAPPPPPAGPASADAG